ncbi:MAG TPA: ATP-binding protein [Xanthobacteraceae bacterium]|jgi:CheY-like chemotaxis protein/anti-sigma regulatory factor (Ser/Thr protein kinase)|nr:ATP-binding protein [Xanthobacteraceae bacterium]
MRARAKTRAKAPPKKRPVRAGPDDAALAVFAHDIRTALTSILALGELLSSSNLDEPERRWAVGIKAGAEHLAALTTLVIDAAKVGSGSLTLQRQIFRPRRVAEALVESLIARAQSKGLQVETTIADDLPETVVGDPVRLRAAVENLIDNAVKFTDKGTVRLDVRSKRAGRDRAELTVCVTDSGIGLKPDEIRRLFRPFTQASAEIARRYGGAGLGLSIVKHLAKLMDGDLTVTSAPGRGSRFCFSTLLPMARADAVETTSSRAATSPGRGLKILCVEDNPYGRVILNTILTELGHHADFAASGEEAIAAVVRGYDVVLMDVTLPGIDGLETTRRIRTLPGKIGATPVIGVSGRTEAGDEEAAGKAGMSFYLHKPLSPSALSKALGAAASSSDRN